MAVKIETSTQKMRSDADEAEQMATQFNSLHQELFNEGRELDKTWEGDANQSFAARMKNDEPKFGELYKIMNEYIGSVRESADDYDRTEASVAEEMKSNSVRTSS